MPHSSIRQCHTLYTLRSRNRVTPGTAAITNASFENETKVVEYACFSLTTSEETLTSRFPVWGRAVGSQWVQCGGCRSHPGFARRGLRGFDGGAWIATTPEHRFRASPPFSIQDTLGQAQCCWRPTRLRALAPPAEGHIHSGRPIRSEWSTRTTRGAKCEQIWASAIKKKGARAEDPSAIGCGLPGQDTESRNISSYWAAKTCRPTGVACSTGAKCC